MPIDRATFAEIGRSPLIKPLEGRRYMDAHLLFRSVTNQQELMLDYVEDLHPKIGSNFLILSVGCGTGVFEMPMLGRLTRRRSSDTDRLYYAGVEVNLAGCEALDHQLADSDLPVDYAVTNPDFNAYEAERRFDLVLFVHVLEYFDDLQATIRKATQLLTPNGRLLVFIAERDGINEACEEILKGHGQFFKFVDNLKRVLDAFPMPYRHERIVAQLDPTEIIRNGNEAEIELLMSFIVQVDTSRLPSDEKRVLLAWLDGLRVNHERGWFVPHPASVFPIRRI